MTLDMDSELAELLEAAEQQAETRRVLERLQSRLVVAMRVELGAVDELSAVAATPARPLVEVVARTLRMVDDELEEG